MLQALFGSAAYGNAQLQQVCWLYGAAFGIAGSAEKCTARVPAKRGGKPRRSALRRFSGDRVVVIQRLQLERKLFTLTATLNNTTSIYRAKQNFE
jgi:hypothetical protein